MFADVFTSLQTVTPISVHMHYIWKAILVHAIHLLSWSSISNYGKAGGVDMEQIRSTISIITYSVERIK